jgi:hypothetical protein
MFRIIFAVAYIASLSLFIYGATTLPEQNTQGSQKTAEEISAEYRQLVLGSMAFKQMIAGIACTSFLIIVTIIIRCCSNDRIGVEPVAIRPLAIRPVRVQPVKVPEQVLDHHVIEMQPITILKKPLGPHITYISH